MKITKELGIKTSVVAAVFIFTYLNVWLAFWFMGVNERQPEMLALPYKIVLGIVSAFGYAAFLISTPAQFLTQWILAGLGLVEREVFGVVTYPTWVTFFVTAVTISVIATVILKFLPINRSKEGKQ